MQSLRQEDTAWSCVFLEQNPLKYISLALGQGQGHKHVEGRAMHQLFQITIGNDPIIGFHQATLPSFILCFTLYSIPKWMEAGGGYSAVNGYR